VEHFDSAMKKSKEILTVAGMADRNISFANSWIYFKRECQKFQNILRKEEVICSAIQRKF
jgi:hypothetical protein